jgi:putative ABC transport system substrate-binding protein
MTLRRITALLLLSLVLQLAGVLPLRAAGKLVAVVLTCDLPRYREAHRAFVKALAQKGYDQNNMEIVVQTPNPDPISWANSVRKLKALGADLIVTHGAPATLAAIRESVDIPLLFVDVYGPVETGISRSLSMTGRNLTGVSSKVPMATLVKSYQEIRPLRTLGVIYSSREVGSVVQMKEMKRLAAQQGFGVVEANVTSPATLDGALSTILDQVDCLYISEGSAGVRGLEKIVHRAMSARVPVITQVPDAAEKGALVTLEASAAEQGQLAGELAARIFGGRSPAQMPISTPKKVELVINMRAARQLDLNVPFQALSAASRVIK